MDTVVHIWRPFSRPSGTRSSSVGGGVRDLIDWGHVAIEVPNTASGRIPLHYWSYWPADKRASKRSYYYDDDVDWRGEAKDHIRIPRLGIESMASKWQDEVALPFDNKRHNCCTVAAEILAAGFQDATFDSAWDEVRRYGRMLKNPIHMAGVMTSLVVSETVVYDPITILDYATLLRRVLAD